jgi:hypothetical protein
MSRLVDFHRGTGTDDQGRTLADLWRFSDEEFELIHDFIQWMFPLREPSQYNPRAPILIEADIAEFQANEVLRDNLRRSFEMFLAFVGLSYHEAKVARAEDFEQKRQIWQYPNHNWLRITRVLASTRTLGLDVESDAFFAFLKELRDGGATGITNETFHYWNCAACGRID